MRIAVAVASFACATVALAAKQSPLSPDFDARNWASIGRTAAETHYSPLTEINRDTVGRLRLAWTLDLEVSNAHSTPLAVDGVLYVAAGYSMVFAVDAQTGKLLWKYDPLVLPVVGRKLRAGSGVRGLAYAAGKLFVGTHDGRLISVDAKTGAMVWSTPTLDAGDSTFISGAPRVFKGKVAIGFGDAGTTPGRVNVFDAATGKPAWSWSTQGGGGAIWNAITYDPDNNRVYVGTGNARGPDAAKNTFDCSVIALNADTGALDWHYDASSDQAPCDASTDITLADMNLATETRSVILVAPKDGSFHVIDRVTGKAVSAKKLGMGMHNQFAQSFSPKTGLIYVPTTELPASNVDGDAPADAGKSALIAWDPVKQQPRWAVPTPGAFSGGVLSTAGDLVFQGQADGYLTAYSAIDGRKAWASYTATAALGAPISYAVGKKQFISILNGPTQGMAGSLGAMSARFGWDSRVHPRRLLTFVLDGTGALPPTPGPTSATPVDGNDVVLDEALVKEGAQLFTKCQWCHGAGAIAGGGAPDLRAALSPLVAASFASVVRSGNEVRGMPKFEELSDRELEALRQYIRARARRVTRPDGAPPQ